MDETKQDDLRGTVPICAIGASAGGVRALSRLFRQLPEDLGLAYVVILHLSPEQPSALAEILSSCTGMPVRQVNDGLTLEADCVYVISPDRELVIEGDSVMAREFTEPRARRAPVDMFFRSVAARRGEGLAVILSGSGADGSNGVRAMHENGGVVLVQDPQETEFAAMPQNAIATGVASYIAPIDRLAERIAEMSRSKEIVRSLDEEGALNDLRRIVGFLRERTGHDFSSYRRATVMRRVLRRMQVHRSASLSDYAGYVEATPEEAHELFDDLLISVTQFFRDEKAFERLASHVAAPLFEMAGTEGIRVWCVGCATGEEAYSLAIVLLEEAARRKVTMPIQIFASDLDKGALGTAREGRYPRSIVADVSEERLARFFADEGTHYRIRKEVRETVLFTSHSVLKDPPFTRLDLISCRNLMIYLERHIQEQLLDLFHYGLRPGGKLFLGSAESAETAGELFAPLDRQARLFQARPRPHRKMPPLPHGSSHLPAPRSGTRAAGRADRQEGSFEVHARALERMAPPSVLVDEAHHILHLSPGAGRYIKHSGGVFSARLPSVVRTELRSDLEAALDRAFGAKLPSMTYPTPVSFDDGIRRISLQVSRVPRKDRASPSALVLFLDGGPVADEAPGDAEAGERSPGEVRRLMAELKAAQKALAASRAEHEFAMEDLRAANEELQSINEEYRSTSEELETSKEELQSTNEELQTVNSELKRKLEDISTAHNDLRNLTWATEIGTLFLDLRLRIRMFTPPLAELFNITEIDVGRKITDFTHRLTTDGIEEEAQRVLHDLTPAESEVQSRDGRWFMMRSRPYRTVENRIEGVVLTFVDVTARRRTERDLIESRLRYETLFDSIDEGFCIMDVETRARDGRPDYRILEVNAAFERQTGLLDIVGRSVRERLPQLEEHWFERYARIATTGKAERFEAPAEALGRYYEVYAFRLETGDGRTARVAALFRDVGERKKAEEQQDLLTRELSHRVKNTLAVVQALARQPGAEDLTVAQYREGFIGRIRALARAHDQLLETNWQSADLHTLIEDTLSAYGRDDGQQLEIEGPALLLTPKQGLGIALILHELATNASKYGALSTPEGQLSVRWHEDRTDGDAPRIRLDWRESGGPPVRAEVVKGFGTKLIERSCAYELDGEAELRFEPAGLEVAIAFPME
ncbi:chemotaxis protein CheB [Histidinibacterium lentulum]|uniref:PAS domain S-box protein n=1 Tax=Histidinibacterium lentulum TaxID=2480588 RepID=A0A3N2QTI1_9RHOB|nr:chemotaxis protein CheB [Histidinibacterium lentulum]ROT98480.1 PAS domain S-box protein [Histidinibacterium lentulum]